MKRVLFVLSLVGQLGYMIALPAALLSYGGAQLDQKLGTSPLFILVGLALAITTSSYWVWTMVKDIERAEKEL